MDPMTSGPLPPRKTRRKRKRISVYYGLIALVLFLFSGLLYTQAAGIFGEEEKPAQRTETSEDLAASSDDVSDTDGDGDIELKQEKPNPNGEKPLEKAKKVPKKKGNQGNRNHPVQETSVPRKSDSQSAGKKGEQLVTAAVDSRREPQPAPRVNTPSDSLSAFERKVVELVNQERAQRGLAPLEVDAELSKVARVKSEDMRDKGYFSHESPTYGSPFDMMRKFGIQFRAAGENIAAGYPTPEAAVKGWMNSSGHRANILSSEFTHIGVGYAKGGAYGHYWTQQFISK